ncbi:hypothetical protein Tsubulata_000100 [Turnera subulata]|uniref:Acid phosphatase n=1 Tax=Turnera subulata TaxID=218843 RepID=A0A9Q0FKQ2_9ROSI|nr:hypothetical protein Tsubulata_000100 [Turnera subulata]
MISEMMERLQEVLIFLFLAIFPKATGFKPCTKDSTSIDVGSAYCLSWRLGVEANNVRAWRTVPAQCFRYVETYMIGGQYDRDIGLIVEQILSYANQIYLSDDGMDAWILDVDDTCISNLLYYRGKRYGLVQRGFKVFLLTGRDQETLGQATLDNLQYQGFIGYERLILRTAAYKGQSAVTYKSQIRKQLEEEGYRVWGNVGDQWSDLQGEYLGNRTFKLPNPMYFVP